jgi:ATP-dependent Clp protease ATP-binding subunit ClpC
MSSYRDVLQECEDVAEASAWAGPALFRDAEIEAGLAAVRRGRSLLLVGPSGVGKSAVLTVLAQRLTDEADIRIRRLTTTQIMAGTSYSGEWQTKLTQLMSEAEKPRTALNVVDVWNLPSTGITSQNTNNLLDAMRPWLTGGRLQLVSEATEDQLREMSRASNLISFFEIVRVEPLSAEQLRAIVDRTADRLGMTLTPETRERLFALAEGFSAASPGPGPMLDLLRKLGDYRREKLAAGEPAELTPLFAEKVFAIYSGLPLFVVSQSATQSAAEIRDWFRARIIGQEAAIDAVVEMIAFYKSRLHDKDKPIGSFLFVGPTGVGKTELARCLAQFFFGSERRMLRFDMSEFADYHAFEMLVGSPRVAPQRPARLVDPVRLQPFQVLLFDELEKAHRNIQDLFLQLLDEGRLTTPQGETVSFRNTIIIATSNVGAFEGMTSTIGFGERSEGYDPDKAMGAIEAHFRPEFLNRFQHVVLFHPLTREQAARIARIDLQAVLRREGIAAHNLMVDVHDDVIDHVLAAGFNARYGGRGLKREIRRQVLLPIAMLLMERALEPGTLIDVAIVDGRVRVRAVDTPETTLRKAERAPVRVRGGERLTPAGLAERLGAATAACEALAAACDVARLRDEIDRVDLERRDHAFWADTDQAGRVLAGQTRTLEIVSRIERLQNQVSDLARALGPGATRADIAAIGDALPHVEERIAVARRELVAMGTDGFHDALIEIMPVGPSAEARDFLFNLYRDWARERRLELVMLHEPMNGEEPVALLLRGPYAHGYLARETGHHRLRHGERSSAARLTVAPLTERTAPVEFAEQRPLKAVGRLGGKIKSRVAIAGIRLMLQNERNLSQNRELARDIAPSWPRDAAAEPPRVRRYDLDPFLVRDYLTGADFTRKDILSPKPFHQLLCDRIDAARGGEEDAREAQA